MKASTPKIIFLKDIYLSSYLKAKNIPLHDTELDEQSRTIFCFIETPELIEAIQQFYKGKALINPTTFIEAFKNLRTLTYSLSGNLNKKKYGDYSNGLSIRR